MTKQEQNEIIIRHIDEELRDIPNIQERVGATFNKWFQALIQMASAPPQEEMASPPEQEAVA